MRMSMTEFKALGKTPPEMEKETDKWKAEHYRTALLEAAELLESDEYPDEFIESHENKKTTQSPIAQSLAFSGWVAQKLRKSAGVEVK